MELCQSHEFIRNLKRNVYPFMYAFFCKKGVDDACDNDFCCYLAVRTLPPIFSLCYLKI